jgi:predicted RNase H-like HicB family nuclease
MREFLVYEDDNGRWIAECTKIPGYRATAKTKEEALAKIKSALLTFYPCKCEE